MKCYRINREEYYGGASSWGSRSDKIDRIRVSDEIEVVNTAGETSPLYGWSVRQIEDMVVKGYWNECPDMSFAQTKIWDKMVATSKELLQLEAEFNNFDGIYHAWYSPQQEAVAGSCTYRTRSGREVEVTEVSNEPYYSSNWPDAQYLGKVETFVRRTGFGNLGINRGEL